MWVFGASLCDFSVSPTLLGFRKPEHCFSRVRDGRWLSALLSRHHPRGSREHAVWGQCPLDRILGFCPSRGLCFILTVCLRYGWLPFLLLLSLVQLQGVLHSNSPGLVMNHRLWGFFSVFAHDFLEGQVLCNKSRPWL